MSTHMHLCIAGGGTGGHVMPALALADAAREQWRNSSVSFIGAERGLEARLLPERGEQLLCLSMHAVAGAGLLQKLRVLGWELPMAVLRIRKHWKTSRPDVVVGVGGYASVAGVMAAAMCQIPVVLYEQNAIPGMVNRRMASLSQAIMLGFAKAASYLPADKVHITGNIVREDIAATKRHAHTPPRLLVLGGSQGARFLNETVPQACALLRQQGLNFTVRHICGKGEGRVQQVGNIYRQAGIEAEIIEFCDAMPAFFAAGDLLVARSGAMTVAEAAACGMPAVFIPLPHAADDHQYFNAQAVVEKGGAIVLRQAQASAETLAEQLGALLADPAKTAEMGSMAAKAYVADAKARQLAVLADFLPTGGAI